MSTGPGELRIGQGVDVHRFSDDDGRPLVLGGVVITGEGAQGLEGHSDADAVAHAVSDVTWVVMRRTPTRNGRGRTAWRSSPVWSGWPGRVDGPR